MARGKLYTGTSGYSYKEWKGSFYPQKLAQSKFLEYYAQKLSTVEINNTFYRFPGAGVLEGWANAVAEDFRFAVKANQGITHRGVLKEVTGLTHDFIERCGVLGQKLGPILFQLPPFLQRNDERLKAFVEILPTTGHYAVEFRHKSWFADEVFETLSGAGVALCISEGEKIDPPRTPTADFCYIRLRKDQYTTEDLEDWNKWIADQLGAGRDVFCYLKHDKKGDSPERVLNLLEK